MATNKIQVKNKKKKTLTITWLHKRVHPLIKWGYVTVLQNEPIAFKLIFKRTVYTPVTNGNKVRLFL